MTTALWKKAFGKINDALNKGDTSNPQQKAGGIEAQSKSASKQAVATGVSQGKSTQSSTAGTMQDKSAIKQAVATGVSQGKSAQSSTAGTMQDKSASKQAVATGVSAGTMQDKSATKQAVATGVSQGKSAQSSTAGTMQDKSATKQAGANVKSSQQGKSTQSSTTGTMQDKSATKQAVAGVSQRNTAPSGTTTGTSQSKSATQNASIRKQSSGGAVLTAPQQLLDKSSNQTVNAGSVKINLPPMSLKMKQQQQQFITPDNMTPRTPRMLQSSRLRSPLATTTTTALVNPRQIKDDLSEDVMNIIKALIYGVKDPNATQWDNILEQNADIVLSLLPFLVSIVKSTRENKLRKESNILKDLILIVNERPLSSGRQIKERVANALNTYMNKKPQTIPSGKTQNKSSIPSRPGLLDIVYSKPFGSASTPKRKPLLDLLNDNEMDQGIQMT